MNCEEGTLTEIGSKWSKKQKRRSKVRENESLNEKISRKTDQQGKWIVENSASGKIHRQMLWSTTRERRKDRLAKPLNYGSSGPRVLDT
jgi:hypothetical protein